MKLKIKITIQPPFRLSILLTTVFIFGCGTQGYVQENRIKNNVPLNTFRYGDGMTCQEKKTPLFENLGFECICSNPYESGNYSMRSKKPGYTTECKNPVVWQAEKDKYAEDQRREMIARQAREKNEAIEKAKAEEISKKQMQKAVNYLKPYCPLLEQRSMKIRKVCANAGNHQHCQKVHDETEPLPHPFSKMNFTDLMASSATCSLMGYKTQIN